MFSPRHVGVKAVVHLLHLLLLCDVASVLAAPVPSPAQPHDSRDSPLFPASSHSFSTRAVVEEEPLRHVEARSSQDDVEMEHRVPEVLVAEHVDRASKTHDQTPALARRKSISYNRNGKGDMRQVRPKQPDPNPGGNGAYRSYYLTHDTHDHHTQELLVDGAQGAPTTSKAEQSQTPARLARRKSPSYNRNGKGDMRQVRPKPTRINTDGNAVFRTYYLKHDTHTSRCGSTVDC